MLFGVRASWVVIDSKPRPQKDLKRTAANPRPRPRAVSPASETHSSDRAVKKKAGSSQSAFSA